MHVLLPGLAALLAVLPPGVLSSISLGSCRSLGRRTRQVAAQGDVAAVAAHLKQSTAPAPTAKPGGTRVRR